MKRVLLVGYDPEKVDFSDPALPPALNAEKIRAGLKRSLEAMAARGWQGENCLISPDATAVPALQRQLGSAQYDCVVIGAGVRLPPKLLGVFEEVVNAIHKSAPGAAIAFNTHPDDTGAAAARWI